MLSSVVVATVLVPVAAWAAENPALVAVGSELERRRRGGIGFGIIPLFCCIVVVGVIAVVVLLVRNNRRR